MHLATLPYNSVTSVIVKWSDPSRIVESLTRAVRPSCLQNSLHSQVIVKEKFKR